MVFRMWSICWRYLSVRPDVFYLHSGKIVLELWPWLIYFLVDVMRP